MSDQTRQVTLPSIRSLIDNLNAPPLDRKTPPAKTGALDTSYMNDAPRTLARPAQQGLSPLYSAPQAPAGSPLNYSEYSHYYNYIRQPAGPGPVSSGAGSISAPGAAPVSASASVSAPSSASASVFPYQGHYQPQRYTANIITSHSEVPRMGSNGSPAMPVHAAPQPPHMHTGVPMGVPLGMPMGMHGGMGAMPGMLPQHLQHQQMDLGGKAKKSHRMTGKRSNLPKETVKILNDWLVQHLNNPYPTPAEKNELLRQTGLTKIQLSNWFINVRRRKVFTDHFDKKLVHAKSESPVSGPLPSAV